MPETRKDVRKEVFVDGYIDALRRLKDVSDCPSIDIEKAKKEMERK